MVQIGSIILRPSSHSSAWSEVLWDEPVADSNLLAYEASLSDHASSEHCTIVGNMFEAHIRTSGVELPALVRKKRFRWRSSTEAAR